MSRTPSHIEREKRVVTQMIKLYCRHKEGNATLCPACQALLEYAHQAMPHPLLQSPDARADANRHALRRTKDVTLSPCFCTCAFMERAFLNEQLF